MNPLTLAESAFAGAVSFDRFGYRYSAEAEPALTDVTLTIEPGEFVLVCGDSGSGKSTFLRAISGLVPHHFGGVASGEVSICGFDLRESDAGRLAAVCGTLLQDPESQSVMDGVQAEIAFPLENLGRSAAEIAIAVNETAAALGIESLLTRRTNELSGGELQRVALAAALAPRPSVLVLDEPTSQLDPVAADELIATLKRLSVDHGTTIVIADHRVERPLEVADRVIAFEEGRATRLDQWSGRRSMTPLAELFSLAGFDELPTDAAAARRLLGGRPEDKLPVPAQKPSGEVVLELARARYRYPGSAADALQSVDLELRAGERCALIGANGSGKSTLLRVAHGIFDASGGVVQRGGEVALLLQNPNDYLIHERVADEAPAESLARFGLKELADRDPRDLSGGERQRLALAIVMQHDPTALLLDEPTRGMDNKRRQELIELLDAIAGRGTAVIVATHDVEFAARFSERTIMLGGGKVLADGRSRELLAGGWHFSTATARLFPGSGALTPQEGAELLRKERARV
jgi:energy-coupling factor transport system ATP-binding protein